MLYSKFYKKHYPFKSPSDVLSLGDEERTLLIKYIKSYHPRAVQAIHKAWKYDYEAKGYPVPTGRYSKKNLILRNKHLGDIAVELRQQCNDLIAKINSRELLTDDELGNVNLILYSNKYCPVLSWFLFPTP